MRSLLVEFSRAGPVIVAVDDVQWLDAATARALAFVARRLDAQPVGVLATVRAPMRSADVLGLKRALGSERFERVRLGPLSLGALGALIEGRLGHRYRRPALLRIEQATGGNPLFALEVARALGPAPTLKPGRALPVPASLREAVAERVAALPPRGRETLLVVAALSHASVELAALASSADGLAVADAQASSARARPSADEASAASSTEACDSAATTSSASRPCGGSAATRSATASRRLAGTGSARPSSSAGAGPWRARPRARTAGCRPWPARSAAAPAAGSGAPGGLSISAPSAPRL